MLILKLLVVSSVCWMARCDLLDLYVQHMDETMRTMAYSRSRHHPKDISSRIKRSFRDEPVLRVGTFKKQRLDVDKEWYAQWKAKRKIHYKNDALDFVNSKEENLEPDQHELLKNQSETVGKECEETTTITSRLEKKETFSDVFDIELSNEESSTLNDTNDSFPKRINDENDDDSAVEIGFSDREEMVIEMETEETDSENQFEMIKNQSDRNLFDDPILKRRPKSRDRVPKKYIPSTEKLAKVVRGCKYMECTEDKLDNREKRSIKEPKFTRHEILDDNGEVILEWDPSDEKMVTFKVTAKTLGYISIGFNEKNHMKGADILLAWVDDQTGTVNLLDSHGIEDTDTALVIDASQDVKVIGGSQNETHTSVIFSRNWQTCDPQDHRLTGDTIRVLWALHRSDPELNTAIWPGDKRGGRALRLKTAAPHSPPQHTQDIRHWDVKLNQPPVSDNTDTTYWCKIFKAPHKEKHHMIGYTPLVEKENEDLVHHIILYECASTLPILGRHARIVGAPCYSPTMPREWESCLQPVLAWARGSTGEWLPEHVGIPIAEHPEGSYYMLEVHYNNPTMKKVVDSSGVRLHLTAKLREQEAGILVAGVAVSPLHLIPPKQKEYATAGYCTPHCTNTMFPETGVNIVSVALHSHLAGRRLSLKHIRQGKELPRIVQDNHFDFEYQQSHTLEKEVKVLPGDELVAECVYGTLDRTKPTLGGYAASQEMCLAFVVHYPRTPLAACYSMTPVKDLFKTLGVYSFRGVTMDHLEKLFLTTSTVIFRTDAVTIPSTGTQQLPVYPATRPSEEIDEDLIEEAKSALKAMRDYTAEEDNDNVFSRLIIEKPDEFRGRTLAEHMLALPWTEELLARSIEWSLYHGRHMTFCRKRDDKLALPADIQMFPNYTALPELNETTCSEIGTSSATSTNSYSKFIGIFTIFLATIIVSSSLTRQTFTLSGQHLVH
ncbi:MOXD1 homolog 1 isoform X1 [Osmia lignaria lignaria]|uniref:MOXD1 homolog 1 isoform X1 n=1 Tax=Osmia lignaria lignaria TaxID=1437193 RepID=UPI00402B38A6